MQWLFIIANHYHVSKYFSSIEMTLDDNWFSTRLPHLKRNKKFYIVRLQHWFLLIERFFSDRAMLTMISSYWCHRMIKIQRSKFSSRSKYILFYLQYPLIRIKHQLVQLLFNKRLPNLLPGVKTNYRVSIIPNW